MSTQSQPAGERQTVRMGIGGVREYTGREAARIIAGHPSFQVVTASSDAMAGVSDGVVEEEFFTWEKSWAALMPVFCRLCMLND